jgi:hypothetical protein
MSTMGKLKRQLSVALALAPIVPVSLAAAQSSSAPRGANFSRADSAVIDSLVHFGVRVRVGRATVYFPRDSFPAARMRGLAARYDSAIAAVAALVPASAKWLKYPGAGVTYFVIPDSFISNTRPQTIFQNEPGGAVLLPFWRVRGDSAPVIHETTHAVLMADVNLGPGQRSAWLEEGFASYVADLLSARLGGKEFNTFETGGLAHVDSTCAARASAPASRAILDFIGRSGRPPNLATDRTGVARPFYTCAESYVKFLTGRLGLPEVAALRAELDPLAALGNAANVSPEDLRASWLRSLGFR